MSIKQNGGVFGRNPTFNDVTIEGQLTFDGDIDINSDLKVDGNLDVIGSATIENLTLKTSGGVTIGAFNNRANAVSSLVLDPRASGAGITGASNVIQPTDENGDRVNGAINFGSADYQFNDAYLSGNLVIGTSGKGIDFSATSGTGTSELLDDYEEGTWTPSVSAGAISGTSVTLTGTYTKIGNSVNVFFNANNSAGDIQISSYAFLSGLPFATQRIGTSTVTSEDVEEASRQGFAATTGTILFLGASGSSSGTTNLACSITYEV